MSRPALTPVPAPRRYLVAGLLPLAVLAGCGHARTFAQLATDAAAVPVPPGVTFVGEHQGVNDGPGFTTTKSEEVARQYASALPCEQLQRAWADALRGAHRRFRITNYPHSFGAIGSVGITITDRPENLGVTIGTDDGHCANPFVYSFNRPH